MTESPSPTSTDGEARPAGRHQFVVPVPDVYRDPDYALLPDGRRVLSLAAILRSRALATPDHPAVIEADSTTSFAELDRLANRVAHALAADGVGPGDRVGYIGANAPSFLAVLYGAAKLGAIPSAVNNRLAVAEVAHILSDARPSVLVLGADADAMTAAAIDLPGLARIVTLGSAEGATPYDSWLAEAADTDPGATTDPTDTAVIFYTSGTTGLPKGIELTGDNIGQALAAMQYLCELDETSVATAPVPFFHVTGFGLALIATLTGAALLLEEAAGPLDLVELWTRRRVSHAVGVPTVIQLLLTVPAVREADWSHLRYIIYGGAPIPEPVMADATAVFGCHFIQSYGLTESTGGITILMPEDHRPTPGSPEVRRLRSVGRPMPGIPVRIVDPATLADLPIGERGEVLIGGGHVMKGYWGNPVATETTILPGGWLRTGDGGSFDDEGFLYLHDRIKDMIVTGGENVYPAEVESVLTGHPAVVEVAVVGVSSQRWGESPYAVVVPKPGTTPDPQEIIDFARERLAHFKCPVGVDFVEALPRNASGKLLKRRLREDVAGSAP